MTMKPGRDAAGSQVKSIHVTLLELLVQEIRENNSAVLREASTGLHAPRRTHIYTRARLHTHTQAADGTEASFQARPDVEVTSLFRGNLSRSQLQADTHAPKSEAWGGRMASYDAEVRDSP